MDLVRRNGKQYHETAVALVLNRFFFGERMPIRVISAQHVPLSFHARFSAKSRTYLYRIATAKQGPLELVSYSVAHTKYIPIEEQDRCYFVQYVILLIHPTYSLRIDLSYFRNTNFDIDKARVTANLFRGTHDFRTFMGATQQNSERDHAFFCMRSIRDISINPSEPVCTKVAKICAESKYNYWDIEITGKSFLYRQVCSKN